MGASPGKKRSINMTIWLKMNRYINFIFGILLGITAYLQRPRADGVIWVAIFLVPAGVTMISSYKLHLGASPQIKAIVSVHIGCCLCLLVYLGIRLIHGMAHQHSTIIIFNEETIGKSSYNPLDYREGWEIVSVIMVVAWLKFLAITTREHLRESGLRSTEVSPKWMLQALASVVMVPLCLACFFYVEGLNTAAKNVYNFINSVTDPSKMSDPIPPVYNPVAKPHMDPIN